MSKPTLKYFNIQARGLVPLLTLEHCGTEFEFQAVTFDEWGALKPTCVFGQLPILQDGDQQIAQTNAIAEYVAFKYNKSLLGETPADFGKSQQLVSLVEELFVKIARAHYDPTDKVAQFNTFFNETLPATLTNLQKLLNDQGRFTTTTTVGELNVYALFYLMKNFANTPFLANFAKLDKFYSVIDELAPTKSFKEKAGKMPVWFSREPKPMEFGYWLIRGLASGFRLFFKHQGCAVKDNKYEVHKKEDGSWDRSEWMEKAKPALKAREPLMNLPYLVDGNAVVTQTDAIWKYLGRKFDLNGKTEGERTRVDMMLCQTMDFRNGFVRLCYSPKDAFDQNKPGYIANDVQTHLAKFEGVFGLTKTNFAASNNVTIADFHLWDMLDQHRILIGDNFLEKYPALQAYYNRFRDLAATQEYIKSDDYKLPLNNKSASFL